MSQKICSDISPEELLALHDKKQKPYLLDVREVDEFKALRTSISHLLPLSQLAQGEGLDKIEAKPEEPIYVICRSGRRSLTACELLHEAGYKKLFNVVGGMEAWRLQNLPLLERE